MVEFHSLITVKKTVLVSQHAFDGPMWNTRNHIHGDRPKAAILLGREQLC